MNEKTVSDFWAANAASTHKRWSTHPVVLTHRRARLGGKSWIQMVKHGPLQQPAGRALSIGCGSGRFEVQALKQGLCETLDAFDISEGALELARQRAADAGYASRINFFCADANAPLDLGVDRYDAIFGVSSVHHVADLENLFRACRAGLKKSGVLIMNEFVGPSRWQLAPEHCRLINDILDTLPDHLRTRSNGKRLVYKNRSLEWFAKTDPSESVRSGEIIEVAKWYFNLEAEHYFGSIIYHFLLPAIFQNFDVEDQNAIAALRLIGILSDSLEEKGLLPPDRALVFARPRK